MYNNFNSLKEKPFFTTGQIGPEKINRSGKNSFFGTRIFKKPPSTLRFVEPLFFHKTFN
jgi:hypothetical protein